MKRIFLFAGIVLGLMLLSFSCSQSKRNVAGNDYDKVYDNSEYELKTQKIVVEGVGVSVDYNTAQFKALANTKKAVLDTMSTIVSNIAKRRGFDTSLPSEFYVSALRHVSYYDDTTHNDGGELVCRSVCTAEIMLQPMLQSLYQEKHFLSEYGYYQFLRDVDRQFMSH